MGEAGERKRNMSTKLFRGLARSSHGLGGGHVHLAHRRQAHLRSWASCIFALFSCRKTKRRKIDCYVRRIPVPRIRAILMVTVRQCGEESTRSARTKTTAAKGCADTFMCMRRTHQVSDEMTCWMCYYIYYIFRQKVALGIFLNPITPWPVSLVRTGRMVACAFAYLHPSVGRKGEPFQLLAEELNHVCALGLTVNQNVQPQRLLFHVKSSPTRSRGRCSAYFLLL